MKKSVYCIFYIENEFYKDIPRDLKRYGYTNLKPIIPTVKILKKGTHGKESYEEVPILFNYGFMRVPLELAFSRDFMNEVKNNIPGIRCWLKSTGSLHPKKKKARIDNMDIFDDFSMVAMATRSEVKRFKRLGKENKRFSVEDILSVKIGDYIILKGYPYDGLEATVVNVDNNLKKIKLTIAMANGEMTVNLPFDQVIDTVYSNYDPDVLKSPEFEVDLAKITSESITRVLDLKTY
jgi:transcription antitermination factor NusG